MLGGHLIKSWSSTQASVSLSSGESEFYGVVKAAGVTLGYQALLRDLGIQLPVRVWTDSSATLGICGRQGLGKLRHIDTQCLWIQQRVRDGTITLLKVRGEVNPADVFTKHLTGSERVTALLKLFNCQYTDGRAASAPLLRQELGTQKGDYLLEVQVNQGEMVDWHGQLFPTAWTELVKGEPPERVAEAFLHDERKLPHQHADLYERFPRAVSFGVGNLSAE